MGIEKKPTIYASDSRFVVKLKESIIQLYDITRKNRIQGDNATFRVTDEPGGRVGHAILTQTANDIAVDWLHLGNNGEKTDTLAPSLKYWLEIDLMANSLINAVTLGSGVAFPTGNDLLVWKLCETNADGKIDKQYRAGTVKDGTLRFTQVVAPDVPIGTIYIWSNALTIPLGWGEVDMKGRVPVGLDALDTDYDTLGATGGNAFVDLSHHHGESLEVPDAYGETVLEGCGVYAAANAGVEDWTGGEPTPDENNILDNRMPYRVVRFIVRTAI